MTGEGSPCEIRFIAVVTFKLFDKHRLFDYWSIRRRVTLSSRKVQIPDKQGLLSSRVGDNSGFSPVRNVIHHLIYPDSKYISLTGGFSTLLRNH